MIAQPVSRIGFDWGENRPDQLPQRDHHDAARAMLGDGLMDGMGHRLPLGQCLVHVLFRPLPRRESGSC